MTADTLKTFTRQQNMPWVELFDAEADASQERHPLLVANDIELIPHVFVVDRDGVLVSSDARKAYATTLLEQIVALPAEVLIHDVVVRRGLHKGPPKLETFLGNDQRTDRAPGRITIEGNHRIEFLGASAGVLAASDVPQYPEMAAMVARRLGLDLREFDIWRVRLDYPVRQSMCRVRRPSGPDPEPPRPCRRRTRRA